MGALGQFRHYVCFGLASMALLIAGVIQAVPSAATPPDGPDFLAYTSSKPYVPLFTIDSTCSDASRLASLGAADRGPKVAQVAGWYKHVNAQSATTFPLGSACQGSGAQPLSSLLGADGTAVSNYRNGSFVSQSGRGQLNFGEATDLETNDPLSILTFWPGDAVNGTPGDDSSSVARLVSLLGSTATTITVSASGAKVPAGSPTSWPYLDSRGTGLTPGAHSADSHNFASWIRVDNEMMQVVAQPQVSNGNVTLTVVRGIWGTAAVAHSATARVFSPVYSGSSSVVPSDAGLSGTPARNDANFPLRYVVKIFDPAGDSWIAGRIQSTFAGQGYNTVWSDVSGCDQYSFAAGGGSPVAGWDDPQGTALTDTSWGAYQLTKLSALRADLPGYQFSANSVLSEGANLACEESQLQSWDSASLENWMNANNGQTGAPFNFAQQMQESFDIQANNWPGIYWARWDLAPNPAAAAQYERLAYGAALLSESPLATRSTFGGPFGLGMPDPLMFWDWGTPQFRTTSLGDVAIPGTPLYGRQFANGLILVNPTSTPYTYSLPAPSYDVVNQTGGQPTPVTSVTVGADDAAFLLQPGSSTENLSVADTTVTRPATGTANATFTVSLPKPASTAVTANYSTFGDTAVSNVDFVPTAGTVTVPAGATTATISVPVTGNQIYQPNTQQFWVTLSNPTGTSLERATASATITNPAGLPALSVPDVTVARTATAPTSANFTISASNPSSSLMQVNWATANGTARSGIDYTAKSGVATIPAGSTTTVISVPVNADPHADGPVTFTVNLTSPTGASLAKATGTATLTDPPVKVGIKSAAGGESGSSAPPILFPITLSGPADGTITLQYATQDGTAKAGTQYQSASGTLTIPDHQTSASIPVQLLTDALPGPSTMFTIHLSNLTGPTGVSFTQTVATGTIANRNPLPVANVNSPTIVRPRSGNSVITFALTLSGPSSQAISVAYATMDGTAVAGTDYQAKSGTARFAAGVTSINVAVTVLPGTNPNALTFTLRLSNPTNATLGTSSGTATLTPS